MMHFLVRQPRLTGHLLVVLCAIGVAAAGSVVALAYVRTEVPDDAPLALAARTG